MKDPEQMTKHELVQELYRCAGYLHTALTLIDGAENVVELFKTKSCVQAKWKTQWLKSARELLNDRQFWGEENETQNRS